jgi:hypothetical protein
VSPSANVPFSATSWSQGTEVKDKGVKGKFAAGGMKPKTHALARDCVACRLLARLCRKRQRQMFKTPAPSENLPLCATY